MRLESSPDYQNCKTSVRFVWQLGTAILLSALFSLCVGCAGISASGAQPNPSNANAKISLSPSTATISSGAQQQFYASLTPTGRTEMASSAIFWHASAGTISQRGLFTAPTVTSSTKVTVVATGVADSTSVAVSEVTVVPHNKIAISLSPATATISSGGRQQFSAALTSTSNTAVTWHASAGMISSNGLFTAPSVAASTKVTVTATSIADGSMVASSQITVVPLSKLSFTINSLPAGTAGTPYSTTLTATGGTAPYLWQITGGSLPQGLSLDKSNGLIAGITAQTGTFSFTASVTDASSTSAKSSLALAMTSSTTGNFDGPAELPRVYVSSDLADTPALGNVISVAKGGDFQQALNSAKCGDTIALQAGAVFTGNFTVPAPTCDNGHWIIVRTSAPDSSLPPEGTRISPCYAGVSSLPGRPAFNCTSSNNVLAKLQYSGQGSGPITFQNGANHYRFIGLEITRTLGTGVVYNLAFTQGNAADHIIFDRSWVHGTAQDETQRGIMLTGMTYAAVVDSYLSDFHCVSNTGACMDAQAIAGGAGSLISGPYKIVDNFLEAAGENILFGGAAATTAPTDIEIRRNHMFKPMNWMQGQPGFVGGADGNPFIVKNLFELKNAQRLLFEANILENAWGGFSQAGFGILLSPKNQAIGTANVCPACRVTDITIRYVTISHVGGAMQIGNGLSSNGGAPLAGERYSIHDLTADDIDATRYNGYGTFAQVSMGPGAPVLQYVTINHVTGFQPGVMLNLGDDISVNPVMNNFVFTNNLVNAGSGPTKTTGGGGMSDCAYHPAPLNALANCFQPYTFTHNAIIGTPANFPPSSYPADNHFPATPAAVGFLNYRNGKGGDYHLQSTSPYKNAGTDGKDLGADMEAIEAALAGVQ
jgi:hypothetical protein